MFTGLIESTGTVRSLEKKGSAGILALTAQFRADSIATGASIAVNGVCLTLTTLHSSTLTFDVSPETLSRSNLGSLRPGDMVNLERAMKLGDRLDGHIVTGHIDCTGSLESIRDVSGSRMLEFIIPDRYVRQLVEKGSVAVDGISLTVNGVSDRGFSVVIIPHTFRETTLKNLSRGSLVNIETDIIGKYVQRLLTPSKTDRDLSLETLTKAGFM